MHIAYAISIVIQPLSHVWPYKEISAVNYFYSHFYNSRIEPNFENRISDVHSWHSHDLGKLFSILKWHSGCWELVTDLTRDSYIEEEIEEEEEEEENHKATSWLKSNQSACCTSCDQPV